MHLRGSDPQDRSKLPAQNAPPHEGYPFKLPAQNEARGTTVSSRVFPHFGTSVRNPLPRSALSGGALMGRPPGWARSPGLYGRRPHGGVLAMIAWFTSVIRHLRALVRGLRGPMIPVRGVLPSSCPGYTVSVTLPVQRGQRRF